LLTLRASVAQWDSVEADAFAMALINEYRPGSPIGCIAALRSTTSSPAFLAVAMRMKFRPYRSSAATELQSGRRWATHESYWRGVRPIS